MHLFVQRYVELNGLHVHSCVCSSGQQQQWHDRILNDEPCFLLLMLFYCLRYNEKEEMSRRDSTCTLNRNVIGAREEEAQSPPPEAKWLDHYLMEGGR